MSELSKIGKYTTSGATVNRALIPYAGALAEGIAVSGDKLFVVDEVNGCIGEYTTSGATVNPTLITGLNFPSGIAVFGGDLFVTNSGTFGSATGTIGEYTTSGATVNASLVSGLNDPSAIVVSGGNLFVTNFGNGTIGEYTTSGATVNAALVSGLNGPVAIAVVSASVPDASSTWTLLLLGLSAAFGLNPLLRRLADAH